MPRVIFTPNLQRHIACATVEVPGATVREVLDAAFTGNAAARHYVLDDQAALRRHMAIFVNGVQIRDRLKLTDVVPPGAEVYIMQALSGG